ncbi:MAG TPA: MFS transporter [Candidatus Micrarchaeaceae archaeon]|nr:MFS transporter [Candidatus Micrarchaeaceae archaeon]
MREARSARSVLLGLAGAGLFVAALDAYLVVTLLPAMLTDVGLTIERFEQATPIVTGFLCGYVIAMPLLGAYSDVRGRTPVYALCVAVFAIGSAVTATATSLPWLVAGRVLQGLGGGGLVPLTLALAADLYRDRARTVALGAVSGLQEAGSVLGPIFGATVASAASAVGGWRFVFWLNVPLAALCGAGLLVASREKDAVTAPHESNASTPVSTVDFKSAGLLGLGLGLLVVALYPDDPAQRATSGLFIPLGILSLLVLALYGWRQVHALEPLIPRHLLRSPRFAGVTAANLLIGAALMVVLLDVPILGRLVFSLNQLAAGLLLTQFLIGVPLGAIAGGVLAGRLGTRWTALAGTLLAAAAFVQMSTWQAAELALRTGPFRTADLALAACGLGFGIVIAPLAATVLQLTRTEHHGLASSLVVLARVMGMLVGLSALTAFGLFRFRQILGTPQLTEPDLRARLEHLDRLVAAAFLQEYREIFTIAAALCILAATVIFITIRGESATATPAPSSLQRQ